MAFPRGALQRPRSEENRPLEIQLGDSAERGSLVLKQISGYGSEVTGPRSPLVEMFQIREQEACKCHARETARHGEPLVVGLRRKAEDGTRMFRGATCQCTIRIAGDDEVPKIAETGVRTLDGGDTFGAVSGSREGDEKGRNIAGEARSWVRHDIRGGDGVNTPPCFLAEGAL